MHPYTHFEKALKEKDEGNSSINTPVNIAVSDHSRLSHCLQQQWAEAHAHSQGCGLGQKTTAVVGCWQLAAAFNTRRMLPTDCQPQLMCASVKFKLTASKSHLKLRAWIFGRHAVASSEALLLSARVRGQLGAKASGKGYSQAHTTVIYPVPSIEHPLKPLHTHIFYVCISIETSCTDSPLSLQFVNSFTRTYAKTLTTGYPVSLYPYFCI